MKSLKALFEIINMVYRILSKRQKIESVFVFASMLLCSALELIGVSLIYPFLQLILTPDNAKTIWYLKWVFNIIPGANVMLVLSMVGVVMIIVYITKNILAVICVKIKYHFSAKFNLEASTDMMKAYLLRPYEFFVETNSSVIIRGITADTDAVYNTLIDLFNIASSLFTISLISVFLLVSDWKLALSALAVSGICFFLSVLLFKNKSRDAGKAHRQASIEQSKCCYQPIVGIKEVKVMGRTDYFIAKFENAAEKLASSYEKRGVIASCPDKFIEAICLSGFIAIICVRVLYGGNLDSFIPTMGVFAMGAFKLLPLISRLSVLINELVFFQLGVKNCYENMIEYKNEIPELHTDRFDIDLLYHNNVGEISGWNIIELQNVTWKYANSKENVLLNLSLTIKRGELIGLIGPSGAGKTTLADVILGLLRPQRGTVLIDGVDVFSIPDKWCSFIGYVPQSVYLIDDTIRANVSFGVPDEQVDDYLVEEALKKAQLYDFVMNLPEKIYSHVGERGAKLSGGQRQRIAIARALYCNPEMLVFDEATSALDNETESAVMESIDALSSSKTIIIIAHRLTTIRNCDKIYEIKNGTAILKDKQEIIDRIVH